MCEERRCRKTQPTLCQLTFNLSIIVHKEWACPRCQQLESCEVNWREHRGRRPCWPWTPSHMWLCLRWQHNHDDPAAHNTQVIHQTAADTLTFLIPLAPDKVSSMCPIFVASVLQPRCLLSLCRDGLYWPAPSRAIDILYHLKCPLHCTTWWPADLSSGNLLYDFEPLDSCHAATYTDARYRHPRARGRSWCVRFVEVVGWGQRERER